MMNTLADIWNRLKARDGVTAIEYAIIAGVIVVAIVGAVALIGEALHVPFNTVSQTIP